MKADPAKVAEMVRKIKEEVKRAKGAGMRKASFFIRARIKEAISVPAPRRRSVNGRYYATTPATPGAPIRKLSGNARRSVTTRYDKRSITVSVNAKSDTGFSYPRYHEERLAGQPDSGQHPFVRPTIEKYEQEILTIIFGEFPGRKP